MAGTSSATASSQLDVVFDGTWVIVPSIDDNGNITTVDIYSPSCGHPHGAVFTPQLNPNPWPDAISFFLLDNHGHLLTVDRSSGSQAGMPVSGIDQSINHCLMQGRPMGGNWDVMLTISIGPDAWVSTDTVTPQTTDSAGNIVPCLSGKDAPTGKVSGLQTLSFMGVTAAVLNGAPAELQALIPAQWNGSGTLIFEGEVPYQPTIQHERLAFNAMANMAGMDLALDFGLPPKDPPPQGSSIQPRFHTGANCAYSLIVLPS